MDIEFTAYLTVKGKDNKWIRKLCTIEGSFDIGKDDPYLFIEDYNFIEDLNEYL